MHNMRRAAITQW